MSMCLFLQTLLKIGRKSVTRCSGIGPLLAHQDRSSQGYRFDYAELFPFLWYQYKYALVIWEHIWDLFFTGLKFAGAGGFS